MNIELVSSDYGVGLASTANNVLQLYTLVTNSAMSGILTSSINQKSE